MDSPRSAGAADHQFGEKKVPLTTPARFAHARQKVNAADTCTYSAVDGYSRDRDVALWVEKFFSYFDDFGAFAPYGGSDHLHNKRFFRDFGSGEPA